MADKKLFYGESDYAVPPGETLKELLEYYHMTQKDLAARLGMTCKTVNEIIKGKAPVSPKTALALENIFEPEAGYWLNLEANYQAKLARIIEKKRITKETEHLDKYSCYAEMAKYGWVPATRKKEEKVVNLRNFFNVGSLEYFPDLPYASNFRHALIADPSVIALAAWLQQGENICRGIETKPFSFKTLKSIMPKLRTLTLCTVDIYKNLRDICASAGIAVTLLPHLKGTYVHGSTRWLSPEKVHINLSTRGAHSDIFWFSFFHEIGHIMLGHTKKNILVNYISPGENNISMIPEEMLMEKEADQYSANTLIPPDEYKYFIGGTSDFSDTSVSKFAKNIDIHPGIVWGRLANDGHISWSTANQGTRRTKLIFMPDS